MQQKHSPMTFKLRALIDTLVDHASSLLETHLITPFYVAESFSPIDVSRLNTNNFLKMLSTAKATREEE
jgi:hypothetical protein